MAKYFLTNKAVEDLSGIWEYTYDVWSERQADKYYGLLMSTCTELAENPEMGKAYSQVGKGILGFHVSRHIIFYQVRVPGEIDVIRILHERMDFKNRISE
ncbi:MAG TPA: type II toxin-antitoxin system RelE/ParE family toxin [Chitinophagaceae bacterium]|nr:type II toxin-antitoxin system RelE/ParE family toxin [Chitinophagaceae bacterium]